MKKLLSVMMLTLALGAFAFSQGAGGAAGGGGGRGQGRGGGGAQFNRVGVHYGLLSHEDVATALKLTDDQKAKIADAAKARGEAMTAARDAGGDVRAAMTKAGEDYNTAVGGILTDDQKKALLGIFVVVAKNPALENPDVQAALGLSDDEKGKIKSLVDDAAKANAALRQQVQDGSMDQAAATEARTKNAKTLSDGLLAALTADHQTAFAKMASDANFTPDPNVRNYFGGRPGGGNRGGGGGAGGGGAAGGGGGGN